MTSNGRQQPRRPAIEIVAPNAGPEETAAIAAALEQFLHDTAPTVAAQGPSISPWARAALLEGVGLPGANPWGDTEPWG